METQIADAFHLARNNEAWEGTEAEKSAAILRAEDYVEAVYSLRADTPTDHPLLVKALCLLALEFLTNPPALKQERQVLKSKEDTAGVLVEEFEYSETPADPYPLVTSLLRPLMAGRSGGIVAMRVVR
jgi:hypothetical protein